MLERENLPCPEVHAGDARSYLERAKWRREYEPWSRELVYADLEKAMELDPSDWEPWYLRCRLANRYASEHLRYLNEAVSRGGLQAILYRAQVHSWLRRFEAAEQDLTTAMDSGHIRPRHLGELMADRACARVQQGRLHEAMADLESPTCRRSADERRLLGCCHWIQGDMAAAHAVFSAESDAVSRAWAYLALGAPGDRRAMETSPEEQANPTQLSGSLVHRHYDYLRTWEGEPPVRLVPFCNVVLALYQLRLTPQAFVEALPPVLRASSAWAPPADIEGSSLGDFIPESDFIWPSEVHFYLGQRYLRDGDIAAARRAFDKAAREDFSGSIERLAARAQLSRL